MSMNLGYAHAQNRYERLRVIAREVTQETLRDYYQDSGSIALGDIDDKALVASRSWLDMRCSRPRAEWSWDEAAKIYRQRHPNRFELSVWFKGSLCGLSYGRPSFASTRLRIELIEGAPRVGNPLGPNRVVPITIMNATAYAGILGAKEIRIMRPIPTLVSYYESLDFTYVKTTGAEHFPDYLYKIIK